MRLKPISKLPSSSSPPGAAPRARAAVRGRPAASRVPGPDAGQRGPGRPPGSARGHRTKSGAGGGPAEPQKVVPTTPGRCCSTSLHALRGEGRSGRPRKESPRNAPAGGLFPPARLRSPGTSPGVSEQRPRARPPTFFRGRTRGGAEGGAPRAQGDLRGDPWRRRARGIPAPLRERKRLNEELRGGSGAPGEEAAGWKQTLASREPPAERRGREGGGGGGARGALTCPFLSSLPRPLWRAGKHERADLPLRRPPRLLASPFSGRPSPVREETARREDGGRPEEPPGLQFLCAPERWEREGGAGKLVGFSGGGGLVLCVCASGGRGREGGRRRGRGARRGLVAGKERERGPGEGAVRCAGRDADPSPGLRTVLRAARLGEPLGLRSAALTAAPCVPFCREPSGTRRFVWILALKTLEPQMLRRCSSPSEPLAFSVSLNVNFQSPLTLFPGLVTARNWLPSGL